jgi:hypothetical protein
MHDAIFEERTRAEEVNALSRRCWRERAIVTMTPAEKYWQKHCDTVST